MKTLVVHSDLIFVAHLKPRLVNSGNDTSFENNLKVTFPETTPDLKRSLVEVGFYVESGEFKPFAYALNDDLSSPYACTQKEFTERDFGRGIAKCSRRQRDSRAIHQAPLRIPHAAFVLKIYLSF